MRIEQRQTLLTIMIAIVGVRWAVSKVCVIVWQPGAFRAFTHSALRAGSELPTGSAGRLPLFAPVGMDVPATLISMMVNTFRHFETYLRQQAAKGYDPKGEYFEGRIDCFFPVAARELLKDGLEPDVLAQFLVSAAHEMMIRDCGLSDQAANDKIIKIAVVLATMLDDPKH